MHFFALFCEKIWSCAGYALAFGDTLVPSDAACWKSFYLTMLERIFPTFPRSYGRKMQPMPLFFA